jgi:hypothetical protein
MPCRCASSFSAAGSISEECEGTDTGSGSARLAPFSFASAIARSTAALLPAITTCPGELRFTASTTSPAAASLHTARTASSSRPRIAAIAPTPSGTAACIASARKRTSLIASAKFREPAATSAAYSPRLWPASSAGVAAARRLPHTPGGDVGRQHRGLGVDGLVEQIGRAVGHQRPQVLPQRVGGLGMKVARTSARSPQPCIMPTDCEPCPGNTNASFTA